jgi:hypothetical protein
VTKNVLGYILIALVDAAQANRAVSVIDVNYLVAVKVKVPMSHLGRNLIPKFKCLKINVPL